MVMMMMRSSSGWGIVSDVNLDELWIAQSYHNVLCWVHYFSIPPLRFRMLVYTYLAMFSLKWFLKIRQGYYHCR